MTRKGTGVLALIVSAVVIFGLPAGSLGRTSVRQALTQTGEQAQAGLESTVQKAGQKTAAAVQKTKAAIRRKATTAKTRVTATDPPHQPPMHGTNPHGQGTVGVVDVDPSAERPLGPKTDGSDSGEDAVAGRARGEQTAAGAFHGHITIVSLFGRELTGVDSTPGQANHGPLQSLQTGILDPLCQSTSQQVCLSVLRADSTTTTTGSTNDFAVARASLMGLNVGAAESAGNISQDANCQTAVGSARTANVATSGGTVAAVANSNSASKSCRGQAPQVANTSQVIQLGGTGIAIPAPGCANGTPDTDAGIPGLLPIICNADEVAGAAAVREALDVFALQVGTNALLKETTAASESFSVAPPETGTQCSDGVDNDNDGKIDSGDPGCHTDNNANNPSSFNPADNDETDNGGNAGSGGNGNNNGNGNNGNGNNGNNGSGNGAPQCSDGVDNDGDGVIDSADPGCHSDGNANNPNSFNPNDNSEGGGGARNLNNAGSLPFTGTDVIGIALAGLLMLAGGLMLRRREDVFSVR
jgi:LPXTG-motif cell wall-anchored protein